MIICICKNITDKDIEYLRAKGLSIKDIVIEYGLGTQCGICLKYLNEEKDDEYRRRES